MNASDESSRHENDSRKATQQQTAMSPEYNHPEDMAVCCTRMVNTLCRQEIPQSSIHFSHC